MYAENIVHVKKEENVPGEENTKGSKSWKLEYKNLLENIFSAKENN